VNVGQLIDQRRAEEHVCIVPDCEARSQCSYMATLPETIIAGVEFGTGDFVDLCWPHAREYVWSPRSLSHG
jgi:hypothetical protein